MPAPICFRIIAKDKWETTVVEYLVERILRQNGNNNLRLQFCAENTDGKTGTGPILKLIYTSPVEAVNRQIAVIPLLNMEVGNYADYAENLISNKHRRVCHGKPNEFIEKAKAKRDKTILVLTKRDLVCWMLCGSGDNNYECTDGNCNLDLQNNHKSVLFEPIDQRVTRDKILQFIGISQEAPLENFQRSLSFQDFMNRVANIHIE